MSKKTLFFLKRMSENTIVEADEALKIKEPAITDNYFQHKSKIEIGGFWQSSFRVLFAMMAMVLTMAFHTYEELPKSVQKKIDKSLEEVYPEKAIIKSPYSIGSEYLNEQQSLKIDDIFQLTSGEEIVGYLVFARADSKFDEFDYAIIYDQKIIIKNVKILAYRENQGGEIGSKRWLKQFIDKNAEDPIALHDDIQGISGATISCVSATEGVGGVTRFLKDVIK